MRLPTLSPSSSWARRTVVSTLSWLRLFTEILKPCSATLRAKFCATPSQSLRRHTAGLHARGTTALRIQRGPRKHRCGAVGANLAHHAETKEAEVRHVL